VSVPVEGGFAKVAECSVVDSEEAASFSFCVFGPHSIANELFSAQRDVQFHLVVKLA
jgi:hypothetical protein